MDRAAEEGLSIRFLVSQIIERDCGRSAMELAGVILRPWCFLVRGCHGGCSTGLGHNDTIIVSLFPAKLQRIAFESPPSRG